MKKNFFYKYKALDKEEEFEHLEYFLQQKVWMTPLEKFNDPFDGVCKIRPLPPDIIIANRAIFTEYFKYAKKDQPNLTENDFEKMLQTLDGDSSKQLYNLDKQILKNVLSKTGALCLTSSYSNIPMWAYYTNYHQGYCVKFELDLEYLSQHFHLPKDHIKATLQGKEVLPWNNDQNIPFALTKVIYGNKPPTVDLMKICFPEEEYEKIKHEIQNTMGFKYGQWKHEKEFRLVCKLNSIASGLMSLEWEALFLKVIGIILGRNMPEEKKDRVIKLCDKYKIKKYQSCCSEYKYKISIKRIV